MVQLATYVVGIVAVLMGIKALASGEIQLSRETKLRQGQARAAGVIVILVGLGLLAFAYVGMGLLLGRR